MSDFERWDIPDQMISVNIIPEPGQPPVEYWSATLMGSAEPTAIPFGEMEELVTAIRPDGASPPPHFIDFRRGYTEWGASGAAQEIVLTLAEWATVGTVGNVVYNSLKRGVVAMARRAQARARRLGEFVERSPLEHDEALERARWHCANKFSIDPDEIDHLRVVGEASSMTSESWVFQFDYSGRLFEVEILDEDGLVMIARSGWKHKA